MGKGFFAVTAAGGGGAFRAGTGGAAVLSGVTLAAGAAGLLRALFLPRFFDMAISPYTRKSRQGV